MTKPKEPTAAEGFERYRRWQMREDAKDLRELAHWQEHVIASADPEAETLIKALEMGWLPTKEDAPER